ncbi:thioredoxin [Brucepastera parasyntrophica]|uniref:thioredoxin n=1 Tax=Brucepastera parasyntrophica TaxID=2880008 RepID=UPI0021096A5C|nr:thioredoxin [Brucepastera parasyntrophica]ULQ59074.1 thioredoxin [Brucepastera parasyntrophica]
MAVLHTNAASFDKVINQDVPVLVDFWAPWCGPCRMLGPVLEEVEKDVAGKAIVAKVNVDEEADLASKFNIASIPTMIIFKKGQGVDRASGYMPKEKIVELIKAHIQAD